MENYEDYDPNIIFKETQRFKQSWLWMLLLATTLAVVLIFGIGIYKQLIEGEEWGTNPMGNTALVITAILTIGLTVGCDILFLSLKLITVVRSEALIVQFFPLTKRKFEYTNISSAKAITYSPMKDFGGWGIKRGLKGTVYNVSGNRGVRLELTTGKAVTIGSEKPEQLEAALKEAARRNGINLT